MPQPNGELLACIDDLEKVAAAKLHTPGQVVFTNNRYYQIKLEEDYALHLKQSSGNNKVSAKGGPFEYTGVFFHQNVASDTSMETRFSSLFHGKPAPEIGGWCTILPGMLPDTAPGGTPEEQAMLYTCLDIARWVCDLEVVQDSSYDIAGDIDERGQLLGISFMTQATALLDRGCFVEERVWAGSDTVGDIELEATELNGDRRYAPWEDMHAPKLKVSVVEGRVEQRFIRRQDGTAEVQIVDADPVERNRHHPSFRPLDDGDGSGAFMHNERDVLRQEQEERAFGLYEPTLEHVQYILGRLSAASPSPRLPGRG